MVRLKGRRTLTARMTSFDFNSTMVRLKETTTKKTAAPNLFQFHYGSVKRR